MFVVVASACALLVREKLFKSTCRAPFVEISKRAEQKVYTYTHQHKHQHAYIHTHR